MVDNISSPWDLVIFNRDKQIKTICEYIKEFKIVLNGMHKI